MTDATDCLWWTALVVLVLLGAGVCFYNTYFTSTDAAIRHAEAFLFRRMTVAQLAEQGGPVFLCHQSCSRGR